MANAIYAHDQRITTAFFPPVRSDVCTLGWLEQLAVGGGSAGVGVGFAIDVLGIIVSHQVVDVFVVGRIHVWVRRLYKVVSPANKHNRCNYSIM